MSIWSRLAGAAGLGKGGQREGFLSRLAAHLGLDQSETGDGSARGKQEKEVAFTIGVIALGAKMAKADGVVTRDEITAFKEVFKVPQGEAANVARIFNLAKQDVAGFESYAKQIASLFNDNRELLRDVLEGLFHIASADGVMHPAEEDYLRAVAKRFGFSEAEFKYIRARFLPEDRRSPYDVLGVSPEIDDTDLKRHYRKLVAENHPDRLVARGVPEEFITIATEKLAAINEAYDVIARERGMA